MRSFLSFRKGLVAVAIIASVSMGIHETRVVSDLEHRIRELNRSAATRQTTQEARAQALQRENRQLRNAMGALQKEIASQEEPARADDPSQQEMQSWRARTDFLTRVLQEQPDLRIPEMQWLTTEDWLDVALSAKLETEDGRRRALSALRGKAEHHLATHVAPAIRKYVEKNESQIPADITELGNYLADPMLVEMLRRWRIAPMRESGHFPPTDVFGKWFIVQRDLRDPDYDVHLGIINGGTIESGYLDPANSTVAMMGHTFQTAHGRRYERLSELWPYATTPEQQSALRRWIVQHPDSK